MIKVSGYGRIVAAGADLTRVGPMNAPVCIGNSNHLFLHARLHHREISLRGLALPIGGVMEKVLAALRSGIRTVMLPRKNAKDVEDVPADARARLEFVFIDRVEDAVQCAIGELPEYHHEASEARSRAHDESSRERDCENDRGNDRLAD